MKKYILFLICFLLSTASVFSDELSKLNDSNKIDIFNFIDKSDNISYNNAQIIILNKITAESKNIKTKINEKIYFGNAEIIVKKCIKDNDQINNISKILLEILENKYGEEPKVIFRGWIFSDSQSISSVEHPVYQIFAKDCLEN